MNAKLSHHLQPFEIDGKSVVLDVPDDATQQELVDFANEYDSHIKEHINTQEQQPTAIPEQKTPFLRRIQEAIVSKEASDMPEATPGQFVKKLGAEAIGVLGLPSRILGMHEGGISSSDAYFLKQPTQTLANMVPNKSYLGFNPRSAVEISGRMLSDPLSYAGLGLGKGLLSTPTQQLAKQSATALERNPILKPSINQAQNEAAYSAGIPLTKAQRENVVSATQPTGFWAGVEAITRSLPGARSIYAAMNKTQQKAAIEGINKIAGGDINALNQDYAKIVSDNITKQYDASKDFFKQAYNNIKEQGGSQYIDGAPAAENALEKLSTMPDFKGLNPTQQNKIGDYLDKLNNVKNDFTINKETGAGENYTQFKNLLTDVNSEIRMVQSAIYQGSQGLNASQAGRYAQALGVIKGEMKNAEYAHLDAISAGNEMKKGLGTYLKNIDDKYGDEIGELNTVKKIFGIGTEIGEKGFKEIDNAVKSILEPGNKSKLNVVMNYLDDSGKQALGNAILSKIIDSSISKTVLEGKETVDNLKIGSFERALNNNRDQLATVLGQDKVNELDNWLVGAKKARMQNINLADEWNKSGTGFKNVILGLIGFGTGGLAAHHSIEGILGGMATAGTGMGIKRTACKKNKIKKPPR